MSLLYHRILNCQCIFEIYFIFSFFFTSFIFLSYFFAYSFYFITFLTISFSCFPFNHFVLIFFLLLNSHVTFLFIFFYPFHFSHSVYPILAYNFFHTFGFTISKSLFCSKNSFKQSHISIIFSSLWSIYCFLLKKFHFFTPKTGTNNLLFINHSKPNLFYHLLSYFFKKTGYICHFLYYCSTSSLSSNI